MGKTNGVIYPENGMGPARDGAVFIMRNRCETCIFHPGNRMHLKPGVVAEMKRSADERGTCIVCHEGMDTPQAAVCRGYYDSHNSALLQVAERLLLIKEQ